MQFTFIIDVSLTIFNDIQSWLKTNDHKMSLNFVEHL
jgi:hypothetical protein